MRTISKRMESTAEDKKSLGGLNEEEEEECHDHASIRIVYEAHCV